ncbi:MAG TPA: CNNM domain-containing protein, partial [Chitinophagaceae bacterium]|nr:CNNM domain-containing protein [Chitinophagaceae bacterium]
MSARKARLESQAENGDLRARRALELSNNPEVFLSAAQIGITLIAILTGVYSGERFSKILEPSISRIEIFRPYAPTIATTIVVIIITFLSIIFGELIPKRIGLLRAEKISKAVAVPVIVFARITHPIVWLLNKVSNLFFKIFNIRRMKDDAVTEEEIKTL